MARMREGTTTENYRVSMGEDDTDDMFSLAYQWQDKPHRHVYDLCGEIDYLNAKIIELQKQRDEFEQLWKDQRAM